MYYMLVRLVTSQNVEQLSPVGDGPVNCYSYTKFDVQGRIIEVGEKAGATVFDTTPSLVNTDAFLLSGTNTQVTKTLYDEPYSGANLF